MESSDRGRNLQLALADFDVDRYYILARVPKVRKEYEYQTIVTMKIAHFFASDSATLEHRRIRHQAAQGKFPSLVVINISRCRLVEETL